MFIVTPFLRQGWSDDADKRHLYIYRTIRWERYSGFVSHKKRTNLRIWLIWPVRRRIWILIWRLRKPEFDWLGSGKSIQYFYAWPSSTGPVV